MTPEEVEMENYIGMKRGYESKPEVKIESGTFKGIKDTSPLMTEKDILRKRQESERVTKEGITDEELIKQNEEDAKELKMMNEAMCNVPAESIVEDKIVK